MKHYVFRKRRWKILFAVVDFFGNFFFCQHASLPGFRGKKLKILIVRLDHLGDGVLLLPLIRELKRIYPDIELDVLASNEVAAVLQGSSDVRQIRILNSHWLTRKKCAADRKKRREILKEIRLEKYDVALDPRGDFRNIFFLWRAKIPTRIGFGSAGGGFLLTRELDEIFGEHEIDRNLRLLEVVGGKFKNKTPQLILGELPEELDTSSCEYCVIHGGAGTEAKRWSLENWKTLINQLSQRYKVFVLGRGSYDEKLLAMVSGNPNVVGCVGGLEINQVWTLIRGAVVYIGVDSGLAHGAGALGVRTIVLESGTNTHERWAVKGDRVECVRRRTSCTPCHLQRCRYDAHSCMAEISPELIFGMVEKSGDEKKNLY